jgi:hypothetical protein
MGDDPVTVASEASAHNAPGAPGALAGNPDARPSAVVDTMRSLSNGICAAFLRAGGFSGGHKKQNQRADRRGQPSALRHFLAAGHEERSFQHREKKQQIHPADRGGDRSIKISKACFHKRL